MKYIIRKMIKPISAGESHYTYNLALKGFEAIKKELNKEKNRVPLDGDETRAIVNRLLVLLDKNEGNLDKEEVNGDKSYTITISVFGKNEDDALRNLKIGLDEKDDRYNIEPENIEISEEN